VVFLDGKPKIEYLEEIWMDQREMSPPIQVGETYKLTCEGIGKKGDGICKITGFVVMVKDAQEGQTYNVKISKVLDKFAFGDIISSGDVDL